MKMLVEIWYSVANVFYVFFSFVDGEESQDYDEECSEEDESLGEERGGRQACVWYEAQAFTLWEEESWQEGQEIVSFSAEAVWLDWFVHLLDFWLY